MKSLYKHPSESPGYVLWRLTTIWQQKLRSTLAEINLTHVQFVYLACLKWMVQQENSVVTQNDLAKLSGLDKMVISDTTKKLLTKKLIKRHSHPVDSRAFKITLTSKGSNLVDKAVPLIEQNDIEFFGNKKHDFINLVNLIS